MNNLLKILCSLPVILIMLYFIPFIGICLIISRYFIYANRKKYYSTPIIIFILGILILIPKGINEILKLFNNVNINNVYLNNILNSDIYPEMINYSKMLIEIGIIFIILSFIFRKLISRLMNYIRLYISNKEKVNMKVSKENDMKIKIKQEKAKNTHVVTCPYCGSTNILTKSVGICKYCRKSIEYKEK